jgi:hypothetical protein
VSLFEPSRRGLIGAGLGLVASRAAAETPSVARFPGWREAVVIVPDPKPWIETLTRVGAWEVVHDGREDQALNRFWSLPVGASGRQVLMRNRGTRTGYLRLVRLSGVDQALIRPDDQAWDVGGIQALDLRVVDIEATRTALHARGWRAPAEPVRYKAYGVEVIQWAPSSPDGVRLSFIQRIAPPLVGWAELKAWSRVANAAVTVDDMAKAQAALGGVVGMTAVSRTNTVGGDGPNVMGLPFAFARTTPVQIVGYGGAPVGDGAVELIALPEARGRNFAANAHPPNLGIAALRVAVEDAAATARDLQARGVVADSPVQNLVIAPYGPCTAFAFTATDGVRLEVFSSLKAR